MDLTNRNYIFYIFYGKINGLNIPNYDAQLQNILDQVTNSNTVWIAGVNCVNNQTSGVIGVGGTNTALPVCPQ